MAKSDLEKAIQSVGQSILKSCQEQFFDPDDVSGLSYQVSNNPGWHEVAEDNLTITTEDYLRAEKRALFWKCIAAIEAFAILLLWAARF